jgi:hypothetical protein
MEVKGPTSLPRRFILGERYANWTEVGVGPRVLLEISDKKSEMEPRLIHCKDLSLVSIPITLYMSVKVKVKVTQ